MRRRQEVELAPNHHTPPWATDDRTAIKQRIGAIGREKGGPAFRQWVSEQSPLDLTVYSDGSLNEDGSAGAGFCVYRGTQEIARGQVPLGHTTEVYDAEIEGALAGLRAAAAHYMARFATKLTICLDNEEAALRLHSGTPTDSSATAILDFKSHKLAWAQRERAPNAAPGAVDVRWCPSHVGIPGNELADQLAKGACQMPSGRTTATNARARRRTEQRYEAAAKEYWRRNRPERYTRLGLELSTRPPPELSLPRPSLGRLLAARSGHGDFEAYHVRFHHEDAELLCRCGEVKAPDHFATCVATNPPFGRVVPFGKDPVEWALGTIPGAKAFSEWAINSRFFAQAGPRPPPISTPPHPPPTSTPPG